MRNLIEPLIKPVSTAALVIVFVIFMLLRLPDLRDRVISLLGSKNLRMTTEALDEAAKKVSQYLVMQTVINGLQGIATAAGLYVIGVPNAVLWGALTMALRFVPYVGIWVAAALPVGLSFAIFDHCTQPAMVAALFIVLGVFSYWCWSRGSMAAAPAFRRSRCWWPRHSGHGCGGRSACCWRFRSPCARGDG